MARAIQTVIVDETTNLDPNPFVNPSGEVFSHWNTKQDNTGDVYEDQAQINIYQPMTLYAQWGHRITWDGNGGETPDPKVVLTGQQIGEMPAPTRPNYIFCGWWNAKDASYGVQIESTYVPVYNMTCYAKWDGETYKSANFTSNLQINNESEFNDMFRELTSGGTVTSGDTVYPLASTPIAFSYGSNNARTYNIPKGLYRCSLNSSQFKHHGNQKKHVTYILLKVKDANDSTRYYSPHFTLTNSSTHQDVQISVNPFFNGFATTITGVNDSTNDGNGITFAGYYSDRLLNGEHLLALNYDTNLLSFEVYLTMPKGETHWCQGFDFTIPKGQLQLKRIDDIRTGG